MDTKLLKQKILDLAIRGKLVPQDPNDEPASFLLEKIKKEKQELIKQGKIKKDKNESTIYVGDDKQHYEKMIEDLPKNWEVIKLNDVLYYEQPTNYIVESTKYSNSYQTPVLTAGKTFILGYTNEKNGVYDKLPCIIFDDFTTESKYVDFSFKVKSSAMKILTNNKYTNLKFLYYSMQTIECIADTHKRFWISDYSNKPIYLPPLAEQQRIVEKIEKLFAQVDKIEEEKQSLLKLIDRAKEKVLDLAMKGKLVKQDTNDEPASVLLEKIFEEKKKLAKEGKIKLSKDELLPPQISDDNDYYEKLPLNWCKTSLKNITKIIAGQSPNGEYLNKIGIEFHQGKLCFGEKYLTTSNVQTNSPTKLIDKNSIVICVRAPVGDVNITRNEICIGRGLAGIIIYHHIDLDFLFYYLKSCKSYFELHGTGSTFKSISSDCIKNLEIVLPPENEQKNISKAINKINAYLTMIKAELN